MTPGGPVMAAVTANVVFMLYSVIGKRIVQRLAAQVEEAFCLFGALTYEKIVDSVVDLRVLQEVLQCGLRIGVAGAEDTEVAKLIE